MKTRFTPATVLVIMFSLFTTAAMAQLNPLSGAYFQNQYLANPAMAGLDKGLNLNLTYRRQWSAIPGAPETQALSGDYGVGRSGVGVTIFNDRAGLQTFTRLTASYAYHLALNESNKLHFGISLGRFSQLLEQQDVKGNPSDVLIGGYNQRKAYIDGDFGLAYESGDLLIQGAFPNLKSSLKKDENSSSADRSTFFAAASYNIQLSGGINAVNITPKVCFRGVQGWHNLVDMGANVSFANKQLMFMAMYHTTQSTSFGVGLNFRALKVSGVYTNETSALRGTNGGDFELNLGINLFKKP